MIRMPPLPVRQNYHARARLSNDAPNFQPVFPGVLHAAVGYVECAPPTHAKNFSRIAGLTSPILGAASRSHLALCQIEDARALPALRGFQQSAAAGLFHIVAMCGNGKNVQGFSQRKGRHVSRDFPARAPRSPAPSAGGPPFLLTWEASGSRA